MPRRPLQPSEPPRQPRARTLPLEPGGATHLPLLAGPPGSVTLWSGLVSLAPGASVGQHTTGSREELLLVLAGAGEFRIAGGPTLALDPGHALYCPPHQVHDVFNPGPDLLRYVYVVTGPPA